MSKTTVSASATALPSRRLLLAAAPAAAVFGSLTAADAEAHPDAELLGAVARQIAAEDEYNRIVNLMGDDAPGAERLQDKFVSEFSRAVSIPSKTIYGMKAKAQLLRRWYSGRNGDLHDSADDGEALAFDLAREILSL